MSGKVYLVGAGPGDPELFTLKGARVMGLADVVVYDFLANPELLALAPDTAEKIYVGKKGGDHTMGQEDINQLLVDLAGTGKTVVRLKGGDPFVFGRGGEEASALFAAGHKFEIVPGVTSAIAAPAYAGIPVTDRRANTEVAFVTGHEDPSKPASTIKWRALAQIGTVVFLMGIKNLPHICGQMIAHGRAADTPAACVRWGTRPQQQSVTGTLATLPQVVKTAGIKPPAITIVGDVVGLRPELSWFEQLPLFGRRVVVTRARAQASRLSQSLRELGAEVLEIPTIAITPPQENQPLVEAAKNVASYDWLMFTSPNGVEAFLKTLGQVGGDIRSLAGVKIAVIGPGTAKGLIDLGIKPDLMAKKFVAEGLLEALEGQSLAGKKILLPRATVARPVLPDTLRKWGAVVDEIAAYRTVPPEGAAEALAQALEQGVDAITFTASSTVANLLNLLDDAGRAGLAAASHSGEITLASIGPITTTTATGAGLAIAVEPAQYTIDALVEALAGHFAK